MAGPVDANGYPYSDYPSERLKRQQRVTNERWPWTDENGNGHALHGVRRRPTTPAVARVVFELDGEEQLRGHVARVANGSVYFEANDQRLQRFGVWLCGQDVTPI